MKKSTALFFICSLVLISGFNAQVTSKPDPTASPIEVKTTTTSIHDKTTTIISTTSIKTTISTTENPKTTSNPTTASVSTSTSAPATTPVPDPQAAKWSISDKDNVIIVNMAVQLSITYNVKNDEKNKTVLIDIPSNNQTIASGNFSSNLQTIILSWKSSGAGNNSFSLTFKKSNVSKTYWLSQLEVQVQAEDLPGVDPSVTLKVFHNQEHFNTSLGNSYQCNKLQPFSLMKENDTQIIGYVNITDIKFQAFKTGHDTSFDHAEVCAFDTPDIVPIAVGCILAGLVVTILVGYLITRRRSQARGYLSM
ncbi:lysosome-associated membrane glycoprotein 1 isoform X2 [Phymastichus coffea]|uniref:lysosome-associated membrane glycoprotein 1 isoform X2 n=1 Tax=Phymastichus coffea TaxID=108790 RepID=UPI00273C6B5E|nr:lysosome-associated membrane glycoprotein 1 isoform X2 [Phymastichus coffea]